MKNVRILAVSIIFMTLILLHELYSDNFGIFSSILVGEIGWWLICLLIFTYVHFVEKRSLGSLGFKQISTETFITGFGGLLLAVFGMAIAALLSFVSGISFEQSAKQLDNTAATPLWILLPFLLRASVVEEVFFRGFIMSRLLENGVSPMWTLAISVIAFVFLHAFFWNPTHLVLVSIAGFSFGLIFLWKRNLVACILAHLGFNFGGIIASYLA